MVLSLLLSTFLTVFIAELGDKTQLATLTISGTSNKPLAVFLGSSSALVFASLLGALTGGSISSFLPEVVLKSIASITFFIIGIRLFINSFTIEKEEKEEKENNIEKSFFSIFITTFTTIFIAELGDKTQIATLMLSAESGKPIIVFLGSSLALISSSIVGVLIGKWVSKKISPSKFALSTGSLMILISIFLAYETFKNYL